MTEINQDNLAKAFEMLEAGNKPEVVLAMFPAEQKEIQELISLLSLLKRERDEVEAPREILQAILEKNRNLHRASGRSSVQEVFNKIINNLNFMNQKLKLSISALGIVAIFVVGVAVYKSNKTNPEIITKKNTPVVGETKLATTTTPVIGDTEVDASINKTLNEALNETNLDAELADVELALNDETALDEINNLVNDNEL